MAVLLFATLWTVALQVPLSMGFSRQAHWSGMPCSSSGVLPDPRIESGSLMSPVLASEFFTTSATWEALKLSHDLSNVFLGVYPKEMISLPGEDIHLPCSLQPYLQKPEERNLNVHQQNNGWRKCSIHKEKLFSHK